MQIPSVTKRGAQKRPSRAGVRQGVRAAWPFALLTIVAIILGLPFFWMIITALKPVHEVIIYPPRWLPQEIRLENFVDAWNAAPFGRFYINSIVTGVATTLLQVVFAAFMAYAFVFIRFPYKRFLFLLVLATMMVPLEMKLVPNYILLAKLDWINTYWALIIPPAAHAFPVFVLEQQFRTLPRDLIDAAKVDGASHFQILVRIVTPVSRPLLAAVGLVSFVGRWNDYLWPLIVTNEVTMRTLPIGLAYLQETQEGSNRWNLLMAGTIFVIIPILILFIMTQKQFVEGITRGAVKS
ncbi:MAG TPA: carbohydrate ABC transporter permease [Candidatus Sulfomarinibacteraceae bacterium]|nr:carbohydrate ABC transporter permease [Candidatus Sulfomarinibacteraceae bacterium]